MVDTIPNHKKPLPECLSAVVTLRRAGFKYREIAKHLHIPIGTCKQRVWRARNEFGRHV